MGVPSATTTVGFDTDPSNQLNLHNVLFQKGYNTGGSSNGVPASGAIITSPNRAYQLGPISGNNSLFLTQAAQIGSLALVSPVHDAALSVLLAVGNGFGPDQGGDSSTLAVNWSNGQSSIYPYTAYDWGKHNGMFGPNSGEAIGGMDRIDRSTGLLTNAPSDTLSLYFFDVDLTADPNYLTGGLIDGITVTRPLPGSELLTLNVMGLSGATSVPEPSALALLGTFGGIAAWHRRMLRKSSS